MGATYKLKRKLADGTLEDVVLQGAGSAEPFIVTFTNSGNNNYTIEETYEDIEQAFANGKIVIGVDSTNSYIYQIFGLSDDDTIPFSRIVNWGAGGAVVETLFVNTDDSVSYAWNTLATTALATATSKGLMSAVDKKKVEWLDLDTSDGAIFTIGDDSVTSAYIQLNNNDNSVNAIGEEVYIRSTFGGAHINSVDGIYLHSDAGAYVNGSKVITEATLPSGNGGGGSCVITDLGEQEDNALAEHAILELLKPTSVPTGKYLYTYNTTCRGDAVIAICRKNEYGINITYISSNGGTYKYSWYDIEAEELQSECWREMGVELTNELGDRYDVAMSQWGVTEALKQAGGGLPFIKPAIRSAGSTYNPTKWSVADVNGVTVPTDGMTIVVRIPISVISSYGVMLTIDNGSNYYPIVRGQQARITTEYDQNATLILTFNATQTVSVYSGSSTTTTVTGCWQLADNDTNNKVSQFYTTTNSAYPLLFRDYSSTTSTGTFVGYTRYANNIYVNPSTGTMYANDLVVGYRSIKSFIESYNNPFTIEYGNYSFAVGEEIDLEVYATDYMLQHIEIYVYQNVEGLQQAISLELYNQNAGDSFDIPSDYGNEYSIIIKRNRDIFDFYIRNIDGVINYLDSMNAEYIYIKSPYLEQGLSFDIDITVKYCWLNTIV